tara:strand:+ start:44 stop:301 length:258 start_codon:yes stop_codon:yes gene_type:complete
MKQKISFNYKISEIDGVFTFINKNTTIGFIRFNNEGEVEYIFVNPGFRRKGIAKKLLKLTQKKIGKKLVPQEPISPLGKKLFNIV